MNDTMGYRDRGKVLQIIGALFLLGSISAAFLGPIELYCFYLFSEGGRFHYAGFGFGSFMFANIASQIIGYYLIAVLGVALGYGHLKLRRWVRPLTVTLLWFWLVMGIPLMIVVYGMYIQAKDPTVMQFAITLPFAAIIYPIAPIHLYRLYRGRDVKGTFESRDASSTWLEAMPLPVRGLCTLFCFYILALHILILLRGVFPMFGTLYSGLRGIAAIDITILTLVGLTWGLARSKRWAWWGSLAVFGLLALSSLITFSRSTVGDLLLQLDFPGREMEAFQNLPFLDWHPTVIAAGPVVVTIGIILAVKRHFHASSA